MARNKRIWIVNQDDIIMPCSSERKAWSLVRSGIMLALRLGYTQVYGATCYKDKATGHQHYACSFYRLETSRPFTIHVMNPTMY